MLGTAGAGFGFGSVGLAATTFVRTVETTLAVGVADEAFWMLEAGTLEAIEGTAATEGLANVAVGVAPPGTL